MQEPGSCILPYWEGLMEENPLPDTQSENRVSSQGSTLGSVLSRLGSIGLILFFFAPWLGNCSGFDFAERVGYGQLYLIPVTAVMILLVFYKLKLRVKVRGLMILALSCLPVSVLWSVYKSLTSPDQLLQYDFNQARWGLLATLASIILTAVGGVLDIFGLGRNVAIE